MSYIYLAKNNGTVAIFDTNLSFVSMLNYFEVAAEIGWPKLGQGQDWDRFTADRTSGHAYLGLFRSNYPDPSDLHLSKRLNDTEVWGGYFNGGYDGSDPYQYYMPVSNIVDDTYVYLYKRLFDVSESYYNLYLVRLNKTDGSFHDETLVFENCGTEWYLIFDDDHYYVSAEGQAIPSLWKIKKYTKSTVSYVSESPDPVTWYPYRILAGHGGSLYGPLYPSGIQEISKSDYSFIQDHTPSELDGWDIIQLTQDEYGLLFGMASKYQVGNFLFKYNPTTGQIWINEPQRSDWSTYWGARGMSIGGTITQPAQIDNTDDCLFLLNDTGEHVYVLDSNLNHIGILNMPEWIDEFTGLPKKPNVFRTDGDSHYIAYNMPGPTTGYERGGVRAYSHALDFVKWETKGYTGPPPALDDWIGHTHGLYLEGVYLYASLHYFVWPGTVDRLYRFNRYNGDYIKNTDQFGASGMVIDSGNDYLYSLHSFQGRYIYTTSKYTLERVATSDWDYYGSSHTGTMAQDGSFLYIGNGGGYAQIPLLTRTPKSNPNNPVDIIIAGVMGGGYIYPRAVEKGAGTYFYVLVWEAHGYGHDPLNEYHVIKVNDQWCEVARTTMPQGWAPPKDLVVGPRPPLTVPFPHSPSISPSFSPSVPLGAPEVWTREADPILSTTAVIHGNVYPGGLSTTVWFEIGMTPEIDPVFDTTTPQVMGSAYDILTFSESISIISGANFYRAVAQNSEGTIYGGAFAFPSPATYSPSASPSPTPSRSASISPSESVSPSASESPSSTISVSPSISPSASESPSVSPSISPSASASPSEGSESPSESPSVSPSASASPSISPSASVSKSPSPSISPSASASPTESPTPSLSISPSASYSASVSPSASKSASASPSASDSPSPSVEIAIRGVTLFYLSDFIGGAATALDSIDGNALIDRDRAFVIVNGVFHVYYLDSDLGGGETTPPDYSIISPDTNAGLKRWVKAT